MCYWHQNYITVKEKLSSNCANKLLVTDFIVIFPLEIWNRFCINLSGINFPYLCVLTVKQLHPQMPQMTFQVSPLSLLYLLLACIPIVVMFMILFGISIYRNHDWIINRFKFVQSQFLFKIFVPGLKYVKLFMRTVMAFANMKLFMI